MENILKNELFEAFASASDSVYTYVCDVKTNVTRWSVQAVEYFDLPGEYMEDTASVWAEKIHPLDREAYVEDISGVFTGKKTHHSCQYRAMNRFGEYVWLECKGTMMRDENGDLSVFAGIMTRLDTQNKYDSLTGLMTIFSFYSHEFGDSYGVAMLMGIDRFRRTVSNYGYHVGDKILVEFAKGVKAICGNDALLYRMNGDEFLVQIKSGSKAQLQELFERVRAMADVITLDDGQKVSLSVSAGAVCYPQDGVEKETLLNNMEHSLEYIKGMNRGHLDFYSDEIFKKYKRMRDLNEDLAESIRNHFEGFELYYQPLVSTGANNDKIAGCEALLRWKGRRVKDSYPMEFIKVLEDNGGIIPVGKWVMEQAVKQQSIWQKEYGNITVSFNVSYQQFMDPDFVESLKRTTDEYGVSPSSMIVELTESNRVENPHELAAIFRGLINYGFLMALDDFGTAYASLEILKELPASFIKIEHSFVRELARPGHEIDYIIIESLMALCRKINCKSIIEGVENEQVNEIVKNMGATYLQGYHFSRPVSRENFESMLKTHK